MTGESSIFWKYGLIYDIMTLFKAGNGRMAIRIMCEVYT